MSKASCPFVPEEFHVVKRYLRVTLMDVDKVFRVIRIDQYGRNIVAEDNNPVRKRSAASKNM